MRLFSKLFDKKFSGAGTAISAWRVGYPLFTPRNYDTLAREAYLVNVVAYKCITLIARNASGVDWVVYKNNKQVDEHQLLRLLQRPNPLQTGSEFINTLVGYFMCSGNAYIEAIKTGRGRVGELYTHRPDRMEVIPSRYGTPQGYIYKNDGYEKTWEIDFVTGEGDIKHLKTFHPLNDWYGMSPIEAAAYAVDQHNESSKYNTAMMQNGLMAGGFFAWGANPREEERKRVEKMLVDRYVGSVNAGRPMVVSGDMKYTQTTMTPKDFEFMDGRKMNAQEICWAFGVNPILLDNQSVSYNNVEQARLELWEDTIIPTLEMISDAINGWIVPTFGESGLSVRFDLSESPVMQKRQRIIDEQARGAYRDGLIRRNEARVAMGWDELSPADGGDDFHTSGFGGGLFGVDEQKSFLPENVKALDSQTTFLLVNELDRREVISSTSDLVKNMLSALVTRFGQQMVEEVGNVSVFENNIRVQDYIIRHSAELVGQINQTTKNELRNEMLEWFAGSEKVSDLANRINGVFDFADNTRSKIIAQTESTAAAGFGALEALTQSGIEQMQWFTSFQNSRDAHVAMDGQVVDVRNGYFVAPGGERTKRPGGFGIASLDINCNCAIGMAITEEEKQREIKAGFWERQEQKRTAEIPTVEKIVKQVFNIQRRALLKRLNDIGSV